MTTGLRMACAALVVAGAGCGLVDDDEVDSTAAELTRPTATTPEDSADISLETGNDSGTDLETSRSETESDLAQEVSDTLSDLGASVVESDTVITLPEEVLFDYDQSELRPDAAATLDRIAEAIVYFQEAPVRVAGHTDSHGAEDYNQQLSDGRAQSVVDYLVGAGIDAGRITPEGFGETQPVAPNENDDGSDNPEGRAQNRRVEIVIQGVDPAQVGG